MQGEIWRRSRSLVAFLVGQAEAEVRVPDLYGFAAAIRKEDGSGPRWSPKTIENTVRDMAAFGLIRVMERGRDRVAMVTVLGRAWLAGVALPNLGDFSELEDAVVAMLGEDADEETVEW